jgi:hypothetical protein
MQTRNPKAVGVVGNEKSESARVIRKQTRTNGQKSIFGRGGMGSAVGNERAVRLELKLRIQSSEEEEWEAGSETKGL